VHRVFAVLVSALTAEVKTKPAGRLMAIDAGLVPPAAGADVLPLTPHTQWVKRAIDSCPILLAPCGRHQSPEAACCTAYRSTARALPMSSVAITIFPPVNVV